MIPNPAVCALDILNDLVSKHLTYAAAFPISQSLTLLFLSDELGLSACIPHKMLRLSIISSLITILATFCTLITPK